MSNKVAFYTLGCKLNFAETSSIGKQFLVEGYEIVDFRKEADVYVINTCTVTENAERECRQIVRRALKTNPGAKIVVTGCYAQLRPEEIASIGGVDLVLGSNEKFEILNHLHLLSEGNTSCVHVTPTDKLSQFHTAYSTDADSRTRAFLKVQDGCDYKCSFCTIPMARGKSRSVDLKSAVDNFKSLLDEGYKEIVLTGVNVGDYGKNIDARLIDLLEEFVKIEGKFRIRISSIEPNLLSDEILELAASTDKIADHFHIPLQSGSDKILRMMHRRYKSSDYENLIYKAVDKIPDLGIGVDVIVGSPGETESDFLETYEFIKSLPVSYLHVFTYSERPGTEAIKMENQVPVNERKRRNNMLRILSEKKRNEFHRKMIGKNLEVLFEAAEKEGYIYGFTSNYIRVKYPFNFDLVNNFKTVNITEITNNGCLVELTGGNLVTEISNG